MARFQCPDTGLSSIWKTFPLTWSTRTLLLLVALAPVGHHMIMANTILTPSQEAIAKHKSPERSATSQAIEEQNGNCECEANSSYSSTDGCECDEKSFDSASAVVPLLGKHPFRYPYNIEEPVTGVCQILHGQQHCETHCAEKFGKSGKCKYHKRKYICVCAEVNKHGNGNSENSDGDKPLSGGFDDDFDGTWP